MDGNTKNERARVESVRVIGGVARPSGGADFVQDRDRAERLAKYLRHYRREVPDECEPTASAFDQSAATCCIRGRATRQIPCRNPNFRGCPYRERENDYNLARGGRVREYER